MGKKLTGLLALVFLLFTGTVRGQVGTYNFTVQTLGGYTTPGVVPFWLRSNQYGSIPLDGASLSFIGSARKDFDLSGGKLFDWGASFEGRANLGQGSNLALIEGYGKVRLGIFELRAGRSKKITGLCDTTLTSGSWAISGTNLGIPEIELAVREYWTLPWFGQLFAFKGNYSHGWMGSVPKDRPGEVENFNQKTFLHQKSFYGRFGKPIWRIKLYGGFNHQVLWGSEQEYYSGPYYNDDFTLSPLETYVYVIAGKRYDNGIIEDTRLGDHLGSIDIGIDYEFNKVKLLIYRQNFYDAGALYYFANIQDGLNGLVLENKQDKNKSASWERILLEFLYTKNQAGELWSPDTPSPYENYYNHGQYYNGWSFKGIMLGTPFIGTRNHLVDDVPIYRTEYFVNNRLYAFHFGCEGSVMNLNYVLKASWSKNFGTYFTTDEEQSTGIDNPGSYGIFGEREQFSTYIEFTKELRDRLLVGCVTAFDAGGLYYNSFGFYLKGSASF